MLNMQIKTENIVYYIQTKSKLMVNNVRLSDVHLYREILEFKYQICLTNGRIYILKYV